jgi:hypothetical protein
MIFFISLAIIKRVCIMQNKKIFYLLMISLCRWQNYILAEGEFGDSTNSSQETVNPIHSQSTGEPINQALMYSMHYSDSNLQNKQNGQSDVSASSTQKNVLGDGQVKNASSVDLSGFQDKTSFSWFSSQPKDQAATGPQLTDENIKYGFVDGKSLVTSNAEGRLALYKSIINSNRNVNIAEKNTLGFAQPEVYNCSVYI